MAPARGEVHGIDNPARDAPPSCLPRRRRHRSLARFPASSRSTPPAKRRGRRAVPCRWWTRRSSGADLRPRPAGHCFPVIMPRCRRLDSAGTTPRHPRRAWWSARTRRDLFQGGCRTMAAKYLVTPQRHAKCLLLSWSHGPITEILYLPTTYHLVRYLFALYT